MRRTSARLPRITPSELPETSLAAEAPPTFRFKLSSLLTRRVELTKVADQ